FDRFLDTGDLVDRNIVHDHDIAAPERGSETLLHVSEEHRPVHRALDNERRDHCTNPQASHESDRFPMSERGVTDQPLAARTAAAQSHHAGICPAFVDEHQLCRVKHTFLRIQRRRSRATSARFCSAAYKYKASASPAPKSESRRTDSLIDRRLGIPPIQIEWNLL